MSSSTYADKNMFYSVDIENATCDCPAGRGGKFYYIEYKLIY